MPDQDHPPGVGNGTTVPVEMSTQRDLVRTARRRTRSRCIAPAPDPLAIRRSRDAQREAFQKVLAGAGHAKRAASIDKAEPCLRHGRSCVWRR